MVTCWERADHLALLGDVYCIFVTFPSGILGQMWYLIVSFPDICLLSYFVKVSSVYALLMGHFNCNKVCIFSFPNANLDTLGLTKIGSTYCFHFRTLSKL